MRKLLEIAKKYADSAEIFHLTDNKNELQFENYQVSKITSSMQGGYALRIIKDGFIGTGYTKNLLERERLVKDTMASLQGRMKADFSFPQSGNFIKLETYSPSIENLSSQQILQGLEESIAYVQQRTDGQFNIYTGVETQDLHLVNSNGLDVEQRSSSFYNYSLLMFPKSWASTNMFSVTHDYQAPNKKQLELMIELYNKGQKEVKIKSGSMPVIFHPFSLFVLLWRLLAATSAKSVFEDISPLKNRVGEQIFDQQLTIIDDPHASGNPKARAFDDEGVATKLFTLIENGRLNGFYNNLEYAKRLSCNPTGHGMRQSIWGGDAITLPPLPTLANLSIAPGTTSFEQMVRGIRKGIIILGALGAHSGNIPNGDFSVGINPGLYIEDGEIVGRVKDGMIAGNIYDVMKNISAIENETHSTPRGRFPAITFEDVKFSG